MLKKIKRGPFCFSLYPFFWLFGIVPLFWPLLTLVIFSQKRKEILSRNEKFIYILALLILISIPIGIEILGVSELSRIPSAVGNVLIWLSAGRFLGNKEEMAQNSKQYSDSFLGIGIIQGVFTTAGFISPYLNQHLPIFSGLTFGRGGYAYTQNKLYYQSWLGHEVARSAGLSGNPTWAGAIAFCILMISILILKKSLPGSRRLSFIAIPCCLVNIYLSQSRNLLFSAIIFFSVLILMNINQKLINFKNWFLVCFLTVILPAIILQYKAAISFAVLINDQRLGSAATRGAIYNSTLDALSSIPFKMLGFGVKPLQSNLVAAIGSHSTYLGLLFKGGVFAVLLFVLLLWSLLINAWIRKSSVGVSVVFFLASWCIFEDFDAGHLVPFLIFYLYNLQKKENFSFVRNM